MKCPNCNETLVMSERQGVEIDYCPTCRGVCLDRGELDKIIEKSVPGSTLIRDDEYDRNDKKDYDTDSYKDQNDPNNRRKKRGGFLSDLFDFD